MVTFRSASVEHPLAIVVIAALATRAFASVYGIIGLTLWPNWLPGPTLWGDFHTYLADLDLITKGFLPYRDFSYNYGPLYLYTMLPFYVITPYLAVLPTIAADVASPAVIYLLLRDRVNRRVAVVTSFAYVLSPFVIVNEGYLWLSSQPITLFILAALLLMHKDRPIEALMVAAVGTLFKQEVAFIVPVLLAAYFRLHGKEVIKGMAAFAATFLVGLSPFLVVAPRALIYSLMYGNFINLGPVEPSHISAGIIEQNVTQGIASTCSQMTIPGAYTGLFCGQVLDTQRFLVYLEQTRIDRFLSVLEPFLLIIFVVAILAVAKSPALLEISCALSVLVLLFVFSVEVHGLYGYYFVPVYAILLAAATDRMTAVIGVGAILGAAFLPEGQFQMTWSLSAVFILIALESRRLERMRISDVSPLNAKTRESSPTLGPNDCSS